MAAAEQLKDLAAELGNPGVEKLFRAAKKKRIGVSKQEVRSFLAKVGSKQIFRPLPESKGKSVSEAEGFRVQMDLIDLKHSASLGFKNILLLIDVFTRKVWARPVRNKEPASVAPVLRIILDEMDTPVKIISSDKGNEFAANVQALLEERNIIHRAKEEKHDPNVLAVLDRATQNVKKRLAESLAEKPGEWATRLPEIIRQYNATPHETLHNETPKEISETPVAKFLVLQDNAQKAQHNVTLLKARKKSAEDAGAFRRPIGGLQQGVFRRGFKATFDKVEQIKEIKGSIITPEGEGEKIDVKRVLPVDKESGDVEATFAQGDARVQKQREILFPLTLELWHFLGDEERSMAAAAVHLKKELGEEYWRILRAVRFSHLSEAVHITPEFIQTQGGFWLKRA